MNEAEFDYLKKKNDVKTQLILYYDIIKTDIDIQCQKLILNLKSETKKKDILYINEYLIEKVDFIFEKNISETDAYFNNRKNIELNESIENIKKKSFERYCLFVQNEHLKSDLKKSNPVGLLIITDFYFNQNQELYIRNNFSIENKKINLEADDKLILLANECVKSHSHRIEKGILNLFKDEMIKNLNSFDNLNVFFNKEIYIIESFKAESLTIKDLKCLRISSIIQKLEENVFSGLINLQELYLINCEIKFQSDIGIDYFDGLDKLKKAVLNGNNIERISNFFFHSMPNLVELNLSNCEIKNIDPKSFSNLKSLEILNLSNNKISFEIETEIFHHLSSLRILYLNYCNMENLSQSMFKHLKNLQLLSLSGNIIKIIYENVFFDMINLNQLILSNSKISIIRNNAFNGLESLIFLDLSCNDIENLEMDTFKGLDNLNELFLSKNKLKILKQNIFSFLTRIKIINLSQNGFEEIQTDSLQGLSNLTALFIDKKFFNQIQSLGISQNLRIIC